MNTCIGGLAVLCYIFFTSLLFSQSAKLGVDGKMEFEVKKLNVNIAEPYNLKSAEIEILLEINNLALGDVFVGNDLSVISVYWCEMKRMGRDIPLGLIKQGEAIPVQVSYQHFKGGEMGVVKFRVPIINDTIIVGDNIGILDLRGKYDIWVKGSAEMPVFSGVWNHFRFLKFKFDVNFKISNLGAVEIIDAKVGDMSLVLSADRFTEE